MKELWHPDLPLAHLMIRGLAVYAFVLLILRLAGKRQIGQMSAAEFVALLLVSNAVQNSMNGGDNSITGGFVLAAVIMALSAFVGWLAFRSKGFAALVQGHPCLLVYKGAPIEKNLAENRISPRELHSLLRRQGVHELKDIHEAVLEANGSLSVLKTSDLPKP